jgi:hypothetical protein
LECGYGLNTTIEKTPNLLQYYITVGLDGRYSLPFSVLSSQVRHGMRLKECVLNSIKNLMAYIGYDDGVQSRYSL